MVCRYYRYIDTEGHIFMDKHGQATRSNALAANQSLEGVCFGSFGTACKVWFLESLP